jgi:hypothetical protein
MLVADRAKRALAFVESFYLIVVDSTYMADMFAQGKPVGTMTNHGLGSTWSSSYTWSSSLPPVA